MHIISSVEQNKRSLRLFLSMGNSCLENSFNHDKEAKLIRFSIERGMENYYFRKKNIYNKYK